MICDYQAQPTSLSLAPLCHEGPLGTVELELRKLLDAFFLLAPSSHKEVWLPWISPDAENSSVQIVLHRQPDASGV